MTTEDQNIVDTGELIRQRRAKLTAMRTAGGAYPNDFRRDTLAADLHARFAETVGADLEANPIRVALAGRIMTRRLMGKASFFHLLDMSGKMQVYIRQDEIPAEKYQAFLHWDIGDIVGVQGTVFRTKTGELSVRAEEVFLLTKSLRPLPDKFHGLSDQELCYRQRYLDLLMNDETRQTFLLRTQIIDVIRDFLKARQFLEVETPMMQVLPGGAAARPFVTHHHALDMPLYLRVAPELYLKRLVVGGFERVFEINRNFRNEGLSTRHNPEFTMLEFYQAYADYRDLMDMTEGLFAELAQKVAGASDLPFYEHVIHLGQPFQRMTLLEAVLTFNPTWADGDFSSRAYLVKMADALGIPVHDKYGVGKIQLEIFEKTVEHQLIQPTFITEYPAEVSPLARRNDHNPFVTDRFELFIGGREIANGFSELNDPDDQAERFREQVGQRDAGDLEAMPYDEDYVTALEYGLPPVAGEGIGIDRLVMLFANAPSIRDVILFPHMRPVGKS